MDNLICVECKERPHLRPTQVGICEECFEKQWGKSRKANFYERILYFFREMRRVFRLAVGADLTIFYGEKDGYFDSFLLKKYPDL